MKRIGMLVSVMFSIAWLAVSVTIMSNTYAEEFNAQMEKFGFYKSDISLDYGRMLTFNLNMIGMVIALIILVFFVILIIFKWKDEK